MAAAAAVSSQRSADVRTLAPSPSPGGTRRRGRRRCCKRINDEAVDSAGPVIREAGSAAATAASPFDNLKGPAARSTSRTSTPT